MPNVDKALVVIPVVSGVAIVCNANAVQTTSITFQDLAGYRPPIMVSLETAVSRQWANGNVPLQLSGSTPVLRMSTKYTLNCPACVSCSGFISFTYGDDVTASLDVTRSPSHIFEIIMHTYTPRKLLIFQSIQRQQRFDTDSNKKPRVILPLCMDEYRYYRRYWC